MLMGGWKAILFFFIGFCLLLGLTVFIGRKKLIIALAAGFVLQLPLGYAIDKFFLTNFWLKFSIFFFLILAGIYFLAIFLLNNRGKAAFIKGKTDKAISFFTASLKLFPVSSKTYCGLGIAHSKNKNFDLAIKNLKEAIKLKPDYSNAFFHLAAAYNNKGDEDRAIEYYSDAIKFNPDYSKAYFFRGSLFVKKNRFTEAKKDFETMLKLNPNDVDAQKWLQKLQSL